MAAATVADRAVHALMGHPTGFFRIHAAYSFAALLTALSGVVVYVLARMLFGIRRRAVALALAFGLTTLAVPYTRIGMEPPLMFWTAASFAACLAARRGIGVRRWIVAGLALGFACSTRMPAAPVLLVPLILFALSGVGQGMTAARRATALVIPLIGLNLLSVEYNLVRCHSMICGFNSLTSQTDNRLRGGIFEGIVGLLFSPGKSMFVTSPMLIVGVIGLWGAFRRARQECLAIAGTATLGIVVLSTLSYWSDELYGARYLLYLVPLLTLGIGYALGWDRVSAPPNRTRVRALATLLAIGVAIQVVAVVPTGGAYPCGYVAQLLGQQRFEQNYCRFVPELSDVVMNFRLTYQLVVHDVGGRPLLKYDPYVGTPGHDVSRRLRFTFPPGALPLSGPDFFWWGSPSARSTGLVLFFLAMLTAGIASLAALRPRHTPLRRLFA